MDDLYVDLDCVDEDVYKDGKVVVNEVLGDVVGYGKFEVIDSWWVGVYYYVNGVEKVWDEDVDDSLLWGYFKGYERGVSCLDISRKVWFISKMLGFNSISGKKNLLYDY